MPQSLSILYTPLPQCPDNELRLWRRAFEAALAPWLDARQMAHVRRFGRPATLQRAEPGAAPSTEALRAGLSRLLARAQLVTRAALRGKTSTGVAPAFRVAENNQGRPLLSGWQMGFSHSGLAAFCALAPAEGQHVAAFALDAESVAAAPPAASAFVKAELPTEAGLTQPFADREALRRWTIKESLLKAAGLGLGMPPASVPTGWLGQRTGLWRGPLGQLGWRVVPCPGHWLCLAQGGKIPPRPNLLHLGAQELLRELARLNRTI